MAHLADAPGYDEVGDIAVFAACGWARAMTANEIDFTGGSVADYLDAAS